MYTNTGKVQKVLIGALAAVFALGMSPAFAAVGDVVQTTDLSAIIVSPPIHCSIGIAVDDDSPPRGYVDDCGGAVIQKINLITGASLDSRNFATEIPERPNAMAYDSSRDGLWICTQAADTTGGMPIYFQDFMGTFGSMADDVVTKEFTITVPPAADFSFFFCDGLAVNLNGVGAADDRIYFSDDINDKTEIYDATGTHIATIDNTLIDASLSLGSGLAVGGNFLYMANNGGGDVFRADLGANPLQPPFVDQFTSGDDRQEDMECDPITFAPTEVMWVRTTPQSGAFPNVITAFEIEPKTCGIGGTPPGPGPFVGGEFMPIDIAALLLASVQINLSWLVPILVSAVGIGLVVTRRYF